MKIIIFDNELKVLDLIERVSSIKSKDLKNVVWNSGEISGLEANYVIKEDDFLVQIGDTLLQEDVIDPLKDIYKAEVNKNVGKACTKGFTSSITGHLYETDEHDQTNFSRRMLTVLSSVKANTIAWKIADGKIVNHTREEFLAVCNELDNFITSKVNSGWVIKTVKIEAATSIDDLSQINLTVG